MFDKRKTTDSSGKGQANSEPTPDRGAAISSITEQIYISNFLGAKDGKALKEMGITATLCLRQNIPASREELNHSGANIKEISHHPLEDGPHSFYDFKKAVEALDRLCSEHDRVLVHCHAGRSRSVAVAAAHLAHKLKLSAEEAFRLISDKRDTGVSLELERSAQRYIRNKSAT